MKKLVLLAALAAALLVGAATFASAATTTYASGVSGTVTVSANVQSKLVMTIATPTNDGLTVAFGDIDPGSTYGPQNVNINIKSNKKYTLVVAPDAVAAAVIGMTNTLPASTVTLTKPLTGAGDDYIDAYSLNVPTNADPGAKTVTVQYTATQN